MPNSPCGIEAKESSSETRVRVRGRDIVILDLLARNLDCKDIAERLFLSCATVKSYTGQIYGKLGAKNRFQALRFARKLGMIPFEPVS